MITESFDSESEAIISPQKIKNQVHCDVCIVTFSTQIENFVIDKFKAEKVGVSVCVNGEFPIYIFEYRNKKIGFYKSIIGAPSASAMLEDVTRFLDTNKFIFFGSAGSLYKDICDHKVIVPTFAYRDEGTSYHYAKASDTIEIKNHEIVSEFLKKNKIAFTEGGVWTTDAFYRETVNNLKRRKEAGCIAVDMECSAIQSVCDFRNLNLYYFLITGDNLDCEEWDVKLLREANHKFLNFLIALDLACDLC